MPESNLSLLEYEMERNVQLALRCPSFFSVKADDGDDGISTGAGAGANNGNTLEKDEDEVLTPQFDT